MRYLDLAGATARKFERRGLDYEDGYQVACLALIEAAGAFDPSRGGFFGIARTCLRRALNDVCSRGELPVHIGRNKERRFAAFGMRRVLRELRAVGINLTLEELAAKLGLPVDVTVAITEACARPVELDRPVIVSAEAGQVELETVGDLIADDKPDPEQAVIARQAIQFALSHLSDKQRAIIVALHIDGYSVTEVARRMKLPCLGVIEMARAAREKMKEVISDEE